MYVDVLYPKMTGFVLRVMLYRGFDLCNGKSYRYGVVATIGSQEFKFAFR